MKLNEQFNSRQVPKVFHCYIQRRMNIPVSKCEVWQTFVMTDVGKYLSSYKTLSFSFETFVYLKVLKTERKYGCDIR